MNNEIMILLLSVTLVITMMVQHSQGGNLYDPSRESCCRGVVKTSNRCWSIGCCGDEPFDYTTQVCCANLVRPMLYGMKSACCGNATYNVEDHVCCPGDGAQLLPVPDDMRCARAHSVTCCAGHASAPPSVYNNDRHVCCQGELHVKPAWNAACCGPLVYVPDHEHDCCAGLALYNATSHLCCLGRVHRRVDDSTQCCADEAYQSDVGLCCSGRVLHRPPPGAPPVGCCGQRLFAYDGAMCCDERIVESARPTHDGCCGRQVYDAVNQLCCAGQVRPRDHANVSCCADGVHNRATQLCCGGVALNRLPGAELECCGRGVFDPLITVCCDGEVHLKTPIHTECCSTANDTVTLRAATKELVPIGELVRRGWRPLAEEMDKEMDEEEQVRFRRSHQSADTRRMAAGQEDPAWPPHQLRYTDW